MVYDNWDNYRNSNNFSYCKCDEEIKTIRSKENIIEIQGVKRSKSMKLKFLKIAKNKN